jgi:hypothetical protein
VVIRENRSKMDGVELRKWVEMDGHRVGGWPEGLVTGDLLVVGVILVGSFTGGPSRHVAWS